MQWQSYNQTPYLSLRFKNLGERANRIVIEKLKQEEEWENYPPEFECAIMGELMEDPVKLPSGCIQGDMV